MKQPRPRPLRNKDKKTENVIRICDTTSTVREAAMNIKPGVTSNASQINLNQTAEPRDVARAGASETSSASPSPVGDSIKLSNSSDLVQQALNAQSDTRAARVNQLKQLYENNQYYVDASAVSRSLISAHLSGD
jgi:flagellar biosynthesis anti-sigma factor FlgM